MLRQQASSENVCFRSDRKAFGAREAVKGGFAILRSKTRCTAPLYSRVLHTTINLVRLRALFSLPQYREGIVLCILERSDFEVRLVGVRNRARPPPLWKDVDVGQQTNRTRKVPGNGSFLDDIRRITTFGVRAKCAIRPAGNARTHVRPCVLRKARGGVRPPVARVVHAPAQRAYTQMRARLPQ
jgi:hypothetical protein